MNALELNETGQNEQIFEEVLFFKLRTTKKQTGKQTINSTYLVSVRCVLDLFFRTLAVNSVSDFFFFFFLNCINIDFQISMPKTLVLSQCPKL